MTRWKASSLSSPREEPNGRIAENFSHRSDHRARSGVVRGSVLYYRAGMEGGAARPQSDWLYAALRSALDSRAWRVRPARFRRWHAVSLDLRRDPQSLGHVENDVSTCLRSLFRCPAELSRRDRRQLLRQ